MKEFIDNYYIKTPALVKKLSPSIYNRLFTRYHLLISHLNVNPFDATDLF